MKQKKNNILDPFFREKMANLEVTPPDNLWHSIQERMSDKDLKHSQRYTLRYAVAASFILITIAGSFYLSLQNQISEKQSVNPAVHPAFSSPSTPTTEPVANQNLPIETPRQPVKVAQKKITPTENTPTDNDLQPIVITEIPQLTQTPQIEKAPDVNKVDFPVYNLKIISNESPVNDEIEVIHPVVKQKKNTKKSAIKKSSTR